MSRESAVRIAVVLPELLGTYGDGGNGIFPAQEFLQVRLARLGDGDQPATISAQSSPRDPIAQPRPFCAEERRALRDVDGANPGARDQARGAELSGRECLRAIFTTAEQVEVGGLR